MLGSIPGWLMIVVLFTLPWPIQDKHPSVEFLNKVKNLVRPYHKRMSPVKPGDWLYEHKESGQTFVDFIKGTSMADGRRRVIYIQPMGELKPIQWRVIKSTADFINLYFNLSVKIRETLPMDLIPERARRIHPSWGMTQILTTYVLHNLLIPRIPKDAAAFIAFTASDLWPGRGWNFVFGQASIYQRVGIWSIFRNGDPEKSAADYQVFLLRTLKTASHEIGHMFSMLHCIQYECNMCGSNHRLESDRHPLALCPECLAKLCWTTRYDPLQRFRRLAEFFKRNSFPEIAEFYNKCIVALKDI